MKRVIFIVLLACTACESQAPSMNLIRASQFIHDVKAAPMTADQYLYDPQMPVIHASQFLLNDK